MFKKKFVLPLALILILSLTACNTTEPVPVTDTPPIEDPDELVDDAAMGGESPSEDSVDENLSRSEYNDIKITPEEAFDIYMEKYPDTKVKQVQLDEEMGNYLYKVEGFKDYTEYELEIDPIDGSILKEHMEEDDDMDSLEITRANVEKVAALVDRALAESGEDAKLEEWTIEIDDGIVELEIEIDKKGLDDVEYKYNVETGQLLEMDD